ncbi:MAG: hypothetical protein J5835_02550 [Bacteroidales bacterium]|nr:hypothetical protein [Bacteroidales bacterium]
MTPEIVAKCGDFSCLRKKDSKDIDDFFHGEYVSFARNRYCKSYCFIHKTDKKLVAAFTLSASSISVKNNKKLDKESIESAIKEGDELPQYPAILLGQLAVFDDYSGMRLGYEVVSFVKAILSETNSIEEKKLTFNNIGARFILVDAKNKHYVLNMYKECGFSFAFSSQHPDADSHKMFFDLATL